MYHKTLIIICILFGHSAKAQEFPYTFFTNSLMTGEYFYSSAKARNGSWIQQYKNKLISNEKEFHSPGNSLELSFFDFEGGGWKADIFYAPKRGVDHFETAQYLSFWMKHDGEHQKDQALFNIRLIYSDSSLSNNVPVIPSGNSDWNNFLIKLSDFHGFEPTKPEMVIGLQFSQSDFIHVAPQGVYLDDIEFLPENRPERIAEKPEISAVKGYAKHIDLCWKEIADQNIRYVKIYRSEDGNDFQAVGMQQPYIHRFADFTGETGKKYFYRISFLNNRFEESEPSATMAAETKSMTDDELLTMVQEASFRYYWEGAESFSGMAKENIPGRQHMVACGASGFGTMALIVGTERGFITREESVTRFVQIVNFLEKAESFHGVYPHFIDGPTGKVEAFFGNQDNGADLVETSFLIQGLLAARQYFTAENDQEKLIRDKITRIWEKAEWDWIRQYPDSKFLYWHWSPDQAWVINHNLIGWNETMVTYLLAIASPTHPVPASLYYSGWANQDSTGIQYRSNWGQTKDGSFYTNGKTYFGVKLDVGVSNGGPLFFTHYSFMGYDPHLLTDKYTNYFINNQNIAKINYRYCVANPKNYLGYGENGWGLTASDGPFDYSADEPVLWQDHGKLTPTGAISSFPYTPDESMKALKNYYFNYGKFLWGEYGFRDAFDLTNNWCSEIYMGLNQAPMTVMIENYRSGLIWKLFMQNPEIQNGLQLIEKESKK